MRAFLDANSGLRSRFARTIEFADYTDAELAKIFRSMAKKNQFRLAEDLDKGLDGAISKLPLHQPYTPPVDEGTDGKVNPEAFETLCGYCRRAAPQ